MGKPRRLTVGQIIALLSAVAGRGRWMDNVLIERLRCRLKYECVYLHAFETGSELRAGLNRWIGYYSTSQPHSALAAGTEKLAA